MNILFFASDNDKASGAFRSMVRLAYLLHSSYGHKVKVVLSRKGDGIELISDSNIPYKVIRSYNWIVRKDENRGLLFCIIKIIKEVLNSFASLTIKREIVNESIDLVHLNTSWTYIGAKAAKKTNTKFVWHIREFLEEDQNAEIWDKKTGYELIGHSDKIIAISQSIKEKYSKLVDPNKICVIYNGLNVNQFYIPERELFCHKCVRILILGTICEAKGQKELIEACKILYEKGFNNYKVTIVGKGNVEYIQELRKLINSCGLERKIEFSGFSSDTLEKYRENDITCVCSASEAFGRVTVEAMLAGTLVIGANTAATVELIDDNYTGLLYTKGDAQDLASKIEWCFQNVLEAQNIAKNGQQKMKNNMSDDKNAKNVNDVYNSIMT